MTLTGCYRVLNRFATGFFGQQAIADALDLSRQAAEEAAQAARDAHREADADELHLSLVERAQRSRQQSHQLFQRALHLQVHLPLCPVFSPRTKPQLFQKKHLSLWIYWVSFGFTGFYWVLFGFIRFYWFLLGFAGLYWVFTRFHLGLLGFTRFYMDLLGFIGFYWVLLSYD